VGDDILEVDHRTGDASGAGASGQAVADYGKLYSTSPSDYLAARWIFVWVSNPYRCVSLLVLKFTPQFFH
jgi:hypothetical protein